MPTLPKISPELIKAYQEEIAKSSSDSTAKRKAISLNKFFNWAEDQGHISQNPMTPKIAETAQVIRVKRKVGLKAIGIVGMTIGLVILIFALIYKLGSPIKYITNFAQEAALQTQHQSNGAGQALSNDTASIPAVSAGNSAWNLYTKLKLTDKNGVPQVGSMTLNFKIFNSEKDGTPLYTSDAKTVTTDSSGSTLISLDGVPSELFFQNDRLYLEPEIQTIGTVQGTTLDIPRIPVSTASNPTTGATNETPVINSEGTLMLASESPAIKAKQGNFLIEGQAVTLKTADGSDGNIEINPDGKGYVHFLFEGNKGNMLNVQGPNLTSGSLYYGMVPNNATGYDLIRLQSGSKLKTKFSVDAVGNTYTAGDLNVAGDIQTAGVDRLTSTGELKNITGYTQNSGNFTIIQKTGESASITKNSTALSDVLNLTLNEDMIAGSHYSALVLNRLGGDANARALFVDNGNAQFDGQIQIGRLANNPDAIGQGVIYYNTTDKTTYVWNGTSWFPLGGTTLAGYWQQLSGVISPVTQTDKIAVGGTDTAAPLYLTDTGVITFSSDTNLYRSAVNTLKTDDNLIAEGIATFTHAPTLAHTGTWVIGSPTWNQNNASVYINPASAVADSNLLAIAINDSAVFNVDAEGDIYGKNLVLTGSTSTGSTIVAGDLSVEGNTTLGDSPTDTISIVSRFAQDTSLVPITTTGTNDLGAPSLPWDNLYITNITSPGTINFSSLSASSAVYTDGSSNLTSTVPTSGQLGYWTRSGTNLYNTNQGDNVGIGTTNPAARLDILGVANALALKVTGGTGANAGQAGGSISLTGGNGGFDSGGANGGNISIVAGNGGVGSLAGGDGGTLLLNAGVSDVDQPNDPNINMMTNSLRGGVTIGNYTDSTYGKLTVSAASNQLALYYNAGGSPVTTFSVDSSGNLSIDASGTKTTIADDLAVNGATSADITSTTTTATIFDATVTTLSAGSAATTLNLGAGGALARAINMGTGTGVDTIHIGDGATGADVITIGGGIGTLAINTGDWDIGTTGDMTGIGAITADGIFTLTNNATISGTLTVGNGTTNSIQSPFGPLNLNYKSAANTWTAGLTLQDTTGNVGIGTTDPGTYKLNINGTGYLGAAAWAYSSDQRLKENILYLENTPTPDSLNKILQLKPAKFDYIVGEKSQLGFIAQDVQKIIPEAVVITDSNTGMLGLKTDFIIPYLVGAIQEQQTQIASLSGQLANLTLTDTGDLNISQDNSGNYQLTNTTDNTIVDHIGAFSNLIAANIKSGAIITQDLATNSFTAFQGTIDHLLITSGLVTPNINVALISPLPNTTDVTVQIGSDATPSGKFAIDNAQGTEVAAIDNQGNATFSGVVHSQNIDDIQALLTNVATDQSVLSQIVNSGNFTATSSAPLVQLDQLDVKDLYITNQAAVNSLSITQSLTLGSGFAIDTNGINTLSSPLKLQSLAMAPVEIMAGLVTIDTHGNVNIAGDLYVAGKITTPDLETAVVNTTDINATGSATFNSLVIGGASDATESAVISNGQINTNSTVGKVTIPAGTSEITINNPKVTDYTMVYVTPTSTTQNNVLYVKSKQNGSFVVGFDNPLSVDVNFNWWIVQVK